jgi:hypothetical protein
MLHGFGSFPGSPWSFRPSKSTGLEPMPLSSQASAFEVRGSSVANFANLQEAFRLPTSPISKLHAWTSQIILPECANKWGSGLGNLIRFQT